LFSFLISHPSAILFYQNKSAPATGQWYFSLATNQHQPPVTIITNEQQPPPRRKIEGKYTDKITHLKKDKVRRYFLCFAL
jgi:hypothetical protein